MQRLFRQYPDAINRTQEIMEAVALVLIASNTYTLKK